MSEMSWAARRACAVALFRLLPSAMTLEQRQEAMITTINVVWAVAHGDVRAKALRDETKRLLSAYGGRTIYKHRRREALDGMTKLAKLYREVEGLWATRLAVYPSLRGPMLWLEEIARPHSLSPRIERGPE